MSNTNEPKQSVVSTLIEMIPVLCISILAATAISHYMVNKAVSKAMVGIDSQPKIALIDTATLINDTIESHKDLPPNEAAMEALRVVESNVNYWTSKGIIVLDGSAALGAPDTAWIHPEATHRKEPKPAMPLSEVTGE